MSEIVWLPSSDSVLGEVEGISALLWDAVQAGTVEAKSFFELKSNPFNASFHPNFVRYRIKTYLTGLGVAAHDEEDASDDPSLRSLPNIGLQMTYKDYEIRIRKSNGELGREVPPAGRSVRTQGFYSQQGQEHLYLPFPERELQSAIGGVNLLLLWVADAELNLSQLLLALPKRGGLTRASVETHWIVPLPKPLVAARPIDSNEDLKVTPSRVASDEAANNLE